MKKEKTSADVLLACRSDIVIDVLMPVDYELWYTCTGKWLTKHAEITSLPPIAQVAVASPFLYLEHPFDF